MEKQRWEESGRRSQEVRSEKRKSEKQEDAGARKGRKVAIHCVFPMICGSRGSKSNLAKAAGAEHLARWEMKNCTPLWREAHFQVKIWKLRCRKSARRFGAKHISKSKCTKHTILRPLWKLRCRKSARRFGAKHISKSNCAKHDMFGPLLKVEMSKKCTPLWREAKSNVSKTDGFGPLFDVQMSKKCMPLWREARSPVSKTDGSRPLFDVQRSTKCRLTKLI